MCFQDTNAWKEKTPIHCAQRQLTSGDASRRLVIYHCHRRYFLYKNSNFDQKKNKKNIGPWIIPNSKRHHFAFDMSLRSLLIGRLFIEYLFFFDCFSYCCFNMKNMSMPQRSKTPCFDRWIINMVNKSLIRF